MKVFARPSKKAKVPTTIPSWGRQLHMVTVAELVQKRQLIWARLENPWLFHVKAAWLVAADLGAGGGGPADFIEPLCPLDLLSPNVDFTRLDLGRPTSGSSGMADAAPANPTTGRPRRGMSLPWQGPGCGSMEVTVDYIGVEETPVVTVENLLTNPLAVRQHMIDRVAFMQLKTSAAGFPGAIGVAPPWCSWRRLDF